MVVAGLILLMMVCGSEPRDWWNRGDSNPRAPVCFLGGGAPSPDAVPEMTTPPLVGRRCLSGTGATEVVASVRRPLGAYVAGLAYGFVCGAATPGSLRNRRLSTGLPRRASTRC